MQIASCELAALFAAQNIKFVTAHPALLAERIYLAENSAPRVVGGEHKFQNLSLIVNWAWMEKAKKIMLMH